jgi:hypothetical protein
MIRWHAPEVRFDNNAPCLSSATYRAVGLVATGEGMKALYQPLHEVPADENLIDMFDSRLRKEASGLVVAAVVVARICHLSQHTGNPLVRPTRGSNSERVWSVVVARNEALPDVHIPDGHQLISNEELAAAPDIDSYDGFPLPRALQSPEDRLIYQTVHVDRGGDTAPIDIGMFRGDHIVLRDPA